MLSIINLPHVRTLLSLHLISKFGNAANEGVTSLKFIEKGIKKEDLALAVLLDFPVQIVAGYAVGRWSRGMGSALKPVRLFFPSLEKEIEKSQLTKRVGLISGEVSGSTRSM
jgi:hypothetical protein